MCIYIYDIHTYIHTYGYYVFKWASGFGSSNLYIAQSNGSFIKFRQKHSIFPPRPGVVWLAWKGFSEWYRIVFFNDLL